ncbi:MAG: pyrrolo-quinoline quinone, partial [Gammaproteobacteria bacterium]
MRTPAVISLALVALLPVPAQPGTTAASPATLAADWALYGGDHGNRRFSPLDQIDNRNVSRLKLAWRHATGRKATFEASPVVVDGIMYLSTPYNDVLALDAASGETVWRYHHELRGGDYCCGPANRGVAVAGDRVYEATIDARLIALDRGTGELIWDVPITDAEAGAGEDLRPLLGIEELKGAVKTGNTGYSANMAPQVVDGKVLVGITGAGYGLHVEFEEHGEPVLSVGGLGGGGHGLRGFLVAYDAASGRELWRWYSVPEQGWEGQWRAQTPYGVPLNRDLAAERAAFARYRDTWRYGGGSVWTTPAVDRELGLIYLGTGNPAPQMDDSTRPGDNLHTVSLVALELATGRLRWAYQQVPHDRWGYDVASPPVLFEVEHGGRKVKAVGQASKLGWFFIHDRETGELLRRSEPFIRPENLFARPTSEGVRVVPGTLGACSWSPVAYHPGLQAVYIDGIYQPSLFFSRRLKPAPGRPWS